MSLISTVLFGMPQRELASVIRGKLLGSTATQIVCGFATVEGIRSLESSLCANPLATQAIVIGAGTFQTFEAFDKLILAGIKPDRLYVHLGHTRQTGAKAKHRFYRYHPMLHSKIYYMEHPDGSASAIIGSHNMTGFALTGLNGEASVMLEGPKDSPEFAKIRNHIQEAIHQSAAYNPGMKEAFSWWAHQSFQGLADKTNDLPREGDAKKTIVILAEHKSGRLPKKDEVVYFELPMAIGKIQSLNAEVHIYLFATLPASPAVGLQSLRTAKASYWCMTRGLELEEGGVELKADWQIDNHSSPTIAPATPPFRPTPSSDMQQVRVRIFNPVHGDFEYLFTEPTAKWVPELDCSRPLEASGDLVSLLSEEYYRPNPEHMEWYLVTALRLEREMKSSYEQALEAMSPEGGSYVMFSLRRRKKSADEQA